MDTALLGKNMGIFTFFKIPLKSEGSISVIPCELEVTVSFHFLVTTMCVDTALSCISASQKELGLVLRLHETFAIKCQIRAVCAAAICVLDHRVLGFIKRSVASR